MNKEEYMRRCIQLAQNGKLNAAPNPMVGAVIVYKNQIIGEGFHTKSGSHHAEVNAINSVKDKTKLSESTIFVSLEPCSHQGKTPPCADLIIANNIPHVVIGCQDPFSKVAGAGIQKLKEAGIKVEVGVLETEALSLIKRFYTFHANKRPYIILKWAESADGYIDKNRIQGKPTRISSPLSTIVTHKRRAEIESILVGRRTALLDNPSLSVRSWYGKNPIRLVLDRALSLPKELHLFNGETKTYLFTEKNSKSTRKNLEYVTLNFNQPIIKQILEFLFTKNIQSVLVEGGAQLHNSFIKENLWDEIHIEKGELIISDGVKAAKKPNKIKAKTYHSFGAHFISYYNKSRL